MRITLRKKLSYSSFYLYFKGRLIIALLVLVQCFAGNVRGQMRQVFVDDLQPDNELNKISFYSPSEGYVAFNRWVGYTTDSGRTFAKKYITLNNVNYNGYSVNLTFGFGIKGVKAFNVDTLILYGDYGAVPAILYSTDQGNNFTLIYQSQLNTQQLTGITDLVFPQNSSIGYASESNRIIKTTNRGKSWVSVYNYANAFFDFVEAVDDNTVYAFSIQYGTRRLVKTTNGGSSWVQLAVPAGQVKYAHFITASNGWLNIDNGQGGLIYYTTNGGVTWVLKNDPLVTPFGATKMKFINDSTGYALVGSFYVYKTTDSGKVWEPLPRDNNYAYLNYGHNDLQLLNNDQLWAGGGHGFLELSTNGGGTPLPQAYFRIDTAGVWKTRTVNLINYSKKNYQYQWFVNDVLISNSYNASYTHAYVSGRDSVKLIVTNGVFSDTITQYQSFKVPPLPAITSFSPATGSTGTMITINGNNFSNITDVQFGGASASSFTIVSSTKITAIVGTGATGDVSLTHLYGTFSASGFTYFPPPFSPPPVITSFSPASGPVGTVVTITGSNFDATPANNIVYFGDTRAIVSSASGGQLTCTVPPGASYKPIFVLNATTHLSAQSFKPFVTTFSGQVSNFAKNSFPVALTMELGYQNSAMYATSADLDNDGKTDLLATLGANSQDTLIAYRNTTSNGSFSFADPVRIGYLSRFANGVTHTYDLDGDGLPDILGANNDIEVPVFRNTSVPGNISFAAPLKVSMTDGSQEVIASDLDGDGKPDLIAAGVSGANGLGVARNTSSPGNISFGQVTSFPVKAGNAVAAGDIDNDGKNDIVVIGNTSTTFNVSYFRNTSTPGTISLVQTDVTLKGYVNPGAVMLADMDGDDKLDVVIKIVHDYIIGRNTSTPGNISFDFSFRVSDLSSYGNGAVGSLSGDDKPDFIAGYDATGRNFDVFLNTSVPGSITQRNPVAIDSEEGTNCSQTADFNNDGKPDVLVTSWNDTQFSIYKNAVGEPVNFPTCSGAATLDADYPGSTFKWQQDNGSGFVDLVNNSNISGAQASELKFINVPASWNGYKYRCVVDGNYYSSTFVIRNRTQPPADISLTSSATSICYGTPVIFTATDLNNSDRQVVNYTWQVDGKNNTIYYPTSSTFTASTELSNNSQVRVIATYRDDCFNYTYDTSNVIVIAVTGGPSSVSISAPVNTVCSGSTVTFTATPVNGGANPVYQWKLNGVNAGTNSPVFTTPALTGYSQVSVQMTTSASCVLPVTATSNTLVVNVTSLTTPSISIYQSSTNICAGANVTFSSTASTSGTPHYQWKKNGQNVGLDNYYYQDNTLVNGDVISLVLTTNGQCEVTHTATSNAITMQINSVVTPLVSITGSTTVNKGQTTSLQATAVNVGTSPGYQWQDSTGTHTWTPISATKASLVYTPVSTGDKVRCQLISNAPCVTTPTVVSAPIIFTVNVPTAIAPVSLNGDLQIYPNPAINILVLDSLKLSDVWKTVEITDMNGRSIMTQSISNQTKVELWIASLNKGMYVAVLRRKNGEAFYYKFVKM